MNSPTDVALGVTVTRTLLGKPDLDINDHLNYQVAPQFLGAQVSWQRNQQTSPFLDGAITLFRTRSQVTEPIELEVYGDTVADATANAVAAIAAFCQDNFLLTATVATETFQYYCEAADYQISWTGPRWVAKQLHLLFSTPRRPLPVVGGF